ncbi:MAG: glycosyltransferase [Scytonema sp. PMC 1069.18]|nr:glycosyltransferase [Scytonema sp. PMC 1069.18]MEC4881142.1 glycosyltransferase [Scytonema sp. PMC 1070.18]
MTTTPQCDPFCNLEFSPAVNTAIALADKQVYAFFSVLGDFRFEDGSYGMNRQALYLHQLALGLVEQGCQVDIFIRREHPDQPEIVEHRLGLRTICLTAGPVMAIPHTQLLDYIPSFVSAWLAFQRQFKRNYVLFQTSDWLSGWIGLQLKNQLGIPLVHTSWAIAALKYLWLETTTITSIRQSVERMCIAQADCVVAGSPQEVAYLRQMISVSGQIKVVPHGINTQPFEILSPAAARQKLGVSPDTRLILYVGPFAPFKGIETLIRACTFLPKSFQLYLVSDNSEDEMDLQQQQYIRALVKQFDLDKHIVFTGIVPRSYLPAYYAAANVCVVPSYYETSGSVSLESMASGTPVIASAIGELRYVVRHGQTGLLVLPFNPDALATGIWDALVNSSRWHFYGLAGQHWVRTRFSFTVAATQMLDLYRSLIPMKKVKAYSLFKHPVSIYRKLHQLAGANLSEQSARFISNQRREFFY